MENPKLGQIIIGTANRDAIHVAIAPIFASERLGPGQHVGLIGDRAGISKTPIGIVDPFLTAPVFEGERFYLFLYPYTITSLRHEWEHPAFGPVEIPTPTGNASIEWISAFAVELGKTYNALMKDAKHWVDSGGDYIMDNSESYKDANYEKWPIFWVHYEIVTGEMVEDHEGTIYTCSC